MLVLLGGVLMATAQTPGIPYQAYIMDTNGGYIPGGQIEIPLANAEILLQFEIRNDKGQVEYIEEILVNTDEYGLASTVIGVEGNGGTPVMGKFSDIDWNGKRKQLYIDIDFSGTGNNFVDHSNMDIVYIPSGGGTETVTTLKDNADGSYTYTGEDGTVTTFSVTQNDVGNPNSLGTAGNIGNVYIDRSTGDMYMHGGTQWINLSSGLMTGIGAPTATNPASPDAGDVYVDESTGDLYTFDGTEWTKQPEASVDTGTGVPTATDPANPTGGDIYVDESTGDVYTYNSTTNMWENQSDVVSTDAGNAITEGTDGLAYFSGLVTGIGAPTATNPASPDAGDVYVDESTGDLYTFDGTEWTKQPEASVDTGTGVPTATDPANPTGGDIYVDESTGDVYTYNSTTNMWENQSDTLANNGLSVDANNTVQLGGALIQSTTITTDATNTLAVEGLQDADLSTNNFDIMVVNKNTGVLEKTDVSTLNIRQYTTSYTATRGEDEFQTPRNILELDNIDAYRNGARVDFVQVNANTIKLDLAETGGCYSGDEIRIVQLQ